MSSVERSWLDLTTGSRETSGPVRHGRGEQGRQAQPGQPSVAMSPGSKHPQHAAKVGNLPLMIRQRAAHQTVTGSSIQRITRWRGRQKVKRINTASVARMGRIGKCAYVGFLRALSPPAASYKCPRYQAFTHKRDVRVVAARHRKVIVRRANLCHGFGPRATHFPMQESRSFLASVRCGILPRPGERIAGKGAMKLRRKLFDGTRNYGDSRLVECGITTPKIRGFMGH